MASMTIYDAKDRFTRAAEGWVGRTILGILVALTGTFAYNGWQTIQQTQEAVNLNGRAESRLEGKFDLLTTTIGQFQLQITAQRAIDDTQTASIAALRADFRALQQDLADHERKDMQELTEHIQRDVEARVNEKVNGRR